MSTLYLITLHISWFPSILYFSNAQGDELPTATQAIAPKPVTEPSAASSTSAGTSTSIIVTTTTSASVWKQDLCAGLTYENYCSFASELSLSDIRLCCELQVVRSVQLMTLSFPIATDCTRYTRICIL